MKQVWITAALVLTIISFGMACYTDYMIDAQRQELEKVIPKDGETRGDEVYLKGQWRTLKSEDATEMTDIFVKVDDAYVVLHKDGFCTKMSRDQFSRRWQDELPVPKHMRPPD